MTLFYIYGSISKYHHNPQFMKSLDEGKFHVELISDKTRQIKINLNSVFYSGSL